MANWKKYIPASVKYAVKKNQRRFSDILNGNYKKFAEGLASGPGFYPLASIEQLIKPGASVANKIHNLSIALGKLNNIVVAPEQVFSFWKLVSVPSQKNGYLKSRAIVGNMLQEDTGGGLCQLSGLIYFLGLHAGLTVRERHAHSLDIYTDEERFAPLGSDATVAFGYKDLRLFNPHSYAVSFSFQLTPEILKGTVSSGEKTTPCRIEFEYSKNKTHAVVTTISKTNGNGLVIAHNRYALYQAAKPIV